MPKSSTATSRKAQPQAAVRIAIVGTGFAGLAGGGAASGMLGLGHRTALLRVYRLLTALLWYTTVYSM